MHDLKKIVKYGYFYVAQMHNVSWWPVFALIYFSIFMPTHSHAFTLMQQFLIDTLHLLQKQISLYFLLVEEADFSFFQLNEPRPFPNNLPPVIFVIFQLMLCLFDLHYPVGTRSGITPSHWPANSPFLCGTVIRKQVYPCNVCLTSNKKEMYTQKPWNSHNGL